MLIEVSAIASILKNIDYGVSLVGGFITGRQIDRQSSFDICANLILLQAIGLDLPFDKGSFTECESKTAGKH